MTVVTWGAMVFECLAAMDQLPEDVSVELIDLRTIYPIDVETIAESVRKTGRAVVVHEAPKTAGFGAEISSLIQEHCFLYLEAPVQRVTGFDTVMPYYKLERAYLPDAERITRRSSGIVRVLGGMWLRGCGRRIATGSRNDMALCRTHRRNPDDFLPPRPGRGAGGGGADRVVRRPRAAGAGERHPGQDGDGQGAGGGAQPAGGRDRRAARQAGAGDQGGHAAGDATRMKRTEPSPSTAGSATAADAARCGTNARAAAARDERQGAPRRRHGRRQPRGGRRRRRRGQGAGDARGPPAGARPGRGPRPRPRAPGSAGASRRTTLKPPSAGARVPRGTGDRARDAAAAPPRRQGLPPPPRPARRGHGPHAVPRRAQGDRRAPALQRQPRRPFHRDGRSGRDGAGQSAPQAGGRQQREDQPAAVRRLGGLPGAVGAAGAAVRAAQFDRGRRDRRRSSSTGASTWASPPTPRAG